MRLTCVADVHLANHKQYGGPSVAGLNQRARAVCAALEQARALADGHPLWVLGDLFDTVRPTPQVVAAAMAAFAPEPCGDVVAAVRLLVGNHDLCSPERGDHALGPCARMPDAVVYERPAIFSGGWAVPYQPGAATEWLPGVLAELDRGTPRDGSFTPLLLLHLGIHDAAARAASPWAGASHDAVALEHLLELCAKHRVRAVFAGNWHGHRVWRTGVQYPELVCQVGALVPTGWDNPGIDGYGTVCRYDTATRELAVHVVRGPRFVSVASAGDLLDVLAWGAGHALYVRWTAPLAEHAEARSVLEHCAGQLAGYQLLTDVDAARDLARVAGRRATRAATLGEAADAYCGRLALPDGVDRDDVRDRVREHLGC